MPPRPPAITDIVLLGAGHAHVEVLRQAAMRPRPGIRYTLVAREADTPYSGMLPGLIRGEYRFEDAHIACAKLAAAAGARLILAEAAGIDLAAGQVALMGGSRVAFDLLSVDVGGVPDMPAGGGIAVKPIGRFLDQLAALEARLAPGDRVAVVGGGAGGTELALALAHRFAGRARIALVSRDAEPIASAPASAQRVVRRALAELGVAFLGNVSAGVFADGTLALSDGSGLKAAGALWAIGAVAQPFLAKSGLACDAAGCIRVDATLRSVSDARVFAAGDCAAIEGNRRPKAGVWAVRAGPLLAANLRRAAAGRKLRPWRPQHDALVILGLGGARAVAWRGRWTLNGRLAWLWKDRIDRRWMALYQRLRPAGDG
ncbi:FAD-dependent oxidoreductase [Limobrevibacterium gyesilva]|uniref:FAD-dependent oxidoreductase n=1 Tax=Limobrevibacterium gyesilva TaxID=2991712 RepID=A0AA41YIZ5_9PROT|nr:FAD-dependent oxidoreductase [Limobrevibacterium gyesilva]MCW3474009.1 FAD-dependent oxidoreductase [Limobrevibacterium gyesilva]